MQGFGFDGCSVQCLESLIKFVKILVLIDVVYSVQKIC